MTFTTRNWLLLLLPVLCSSCASVVGKRDANSLTITSDPADALVVINGAEVGRTPYALTYVKEMGKDILIELRKDGYQPVNSTVRVERQNGVLFADAMLLGIPYIFDSKSPNLYKFHVQQLEYPLFKEVPEDLQRVDLPVVNMESVVGNASVGKIGTRSINASSKELVDLNHMEMASSNIIRGLRGTWVDAGSVRLGTAKGDERVQRAKFYLKPTLKAVRIDVKEKDKRVFGPVELDMTWAVHSAARKDSVLFTIAQTSRQVVAGIPAREMIASGLEVAARRFTEDPTLHERLLAAYNSGLVASKGSELLLPKPVPITFAGRKEMLGALVKGVVTLETKTGHGSGFLVTNDGYIITNAHVVGDAAIVKVRFEQGFALDGQVVKVNRDFDLALVKAAGSDLPALSIGDDTALQLGEEIFAIGTPLDKQLGQTVTRGIMSGRREIEGRNYLQTDVSINPGNSGGPLIEESGKVVGVATLKVSGKGIEGIGFGVPISKALEMLNLRFAQ